MVAGRIDPIYRRKRREKKRDIEDLMLKTRITDRYGLKVPFINAGMAFVATAPLARGLGSIQGPIQAPKVLFGLNDWVRPASSVDYLVPANSPFESALIKDWSERCTVLGGTESAAHVS
jgi:hypothetical protein